ncbi:zf-TFIIB domain-containing protein [Aeromicrobium sp. CF3.5]|uniref:TFIIB-type zinc ribbon-containing protein n=1 Tax=Aeromicrobium sp. CF3.5 TaxID=3373078 RepID=UPI003EE53370
MKCPNDDATLTMSERSGVEIDYCPECRGVWLDRGELDKILDRVASEAPPAAAAPTLQAPPEQYREPQYERDQYRDERQRDDRYRQSDSRGYDQKPYRKKKKEHWLMEMLG